MDSSFDHELVWAKAQMTRVQRALEDLPDLTGMRLACSLHLDLKMAPLLEGLLQRNALLFVITANPSTVRDEVAQHLQSAGATVDAWFGMPQQAYLDSIQHALDWAPTHLCEMGADLSAALYARSPAQVQVRAGLEATGSGISRLAKLPLDYPMFNWDDLPVKEGLHNRYMVGLTSWHTFFEHTHLTLHGRKALVVGYGSVGRGLASVGRAYGGQMMVAERDPARAMEARYAGWDVRPLEEALPEADVIVTATGAPNVIAAHLLPVLKAGAFLLNVGHRPDEIDVQALLSHPHETALPFVEAVHLGPRTVYLFSGGSMANLTAGYGDSLNAFDLTLAVLTAGIGFIAGAGEGAAPGVHLLPEEVWEPYV